MARFDATANGKLVITIVLDGAEAEQLAAALLKMGVPLSPADPPRPLEPPGPNGAK